MAIIDIGPDKNSKRLCEDGFFTDYLAYTQHQESPEDFHMWTALGVISATVGRNIWVDRGYFKLYPNLFITLVSESGTFHKSTTVNIGTNILYSADVGRIPFAEKITSQALIKNLSEVYKKTGESVGLINAPEFSVFFGRGKHDQELLELITDWYDCPDARAYETIGRGKEVFNNIAITLLSGSTPEWLQTSLPESAIGGGFTSRIIFVHRQESGKPRVSRPERYMKGEILAHKENCKHDLKIISSLRGQFNWESDAEKWFDDWYNIHKIDEVHPKLRGYYSRKGDMILKVAMCLAVSKSNNLLLTDEHLESARILLTENERFLTSMVDMISENDTGKKNAHVEETIRKFGSISYGKLLGLCRRSMNAYEVKMCLQTLVDSHIIRVSKTKDTRGIVYEYIR